MKESVKQLHKALVNLERQVDRAEDKGGKCITLTLEEANTVIRAMYQVVFGESDE